MGNKLGPGRAVESLQAEVQQELRQAGVPEEEVVKKPAVEVTSWWVIGFDKRVQLMTAAEVQEFIYAGGQPMVMAEDQQGGWKKADELGFKLVRPSIIEAEKEVEEAPEPEQVGIAATASDLDLQNPIIAKLETLPDLELCKLADQKKIELPTLTGGSLDRVKLVKALFDSGVVP